jgi:hypothetical protein
MFVNERQHQRTIDYERHVLIRRVGAGPDALGFWVLEWDGRTIPFTTVHHGRSCADSPTRIVDYEIEGIGRGFGHLRPKIPGYRFATEDERQEAASLIAEALSVFVFNFGDKREAIGTITFRAMERP